jgi:hypothetical protein
MFREGRMCGFFWHNLFNVIKIRLNVFPKKLCLKRAQVELPARAGTSQLELDATYACSPTGDDREFNVGIFILFSSDTGT